MTATQSTALDHVILVDKNDNEIGTAQKLMAHQHNLLHRAFSIFIFRESKDLELLIQKRAAQKYHSQGLWTNTCCSHPRQHETLIDAGKRRLQEELGFMTHLKKVGSFYYNAHFENGLSEHEIDHVLVGMVESNQVVKPDPEEVEAYRFITLHDLQKELTHSPQHFTPWLSQALQIVRSTIFGDDAE